MVGPLVMEEDGRLEQVFEPKRPRVLTSDNKSQLQKDRLAYQPAVPRVLRGPRALQDGGERRTVHEMQFDAICEHFPQLTAKPIRLVRFEAADTPAAWSDKPLRVGVTLSGGQAAGGHNVIVGVFDNLQKWRPGSKVFGFLHGPRGILENQHIELTQEVIDQYRNQGGFHMIGSGRDKIETPEELEAAAATCNALALDGLISIGEDDPCTNVAEVAEYFLQKGVSTRVISVPKTIDGDLKNQDVAISFGFDTACKVYSELIGNIMIDAASAGKYFHFIRLMGRSASHITLECALQTHPQMALVSEEVAANRLSLHDLAVQIADMVEGRVECGRNYGVILIPEGLIEQVHDVSELITEINEILGCGVCHEDHQAVAERLSPHSREVFASMPLAFKYELLLERDPHGHVQVARISTEKLLIRLTEHELAKRAAAGQFKGKFNALSHYCGYEGRSSFPTNFDATYCYALGQTAAELVGAGQTGLMATVFDLQRPAMEWGVGGTPLVSMMALEIKGGKQRPAILPAVVKMDSPVMQTFRQLRGRWALRDCYRCPGPIQYNDPASANTATMTLAVEINNGEPISVV